MDTAQGTQTSPQTYRLERVAMDAAVLGRHGDVGMASGCWCATVLRLPRAGSPWRVLITVFSVMNSLLGLVQWLLFGRKIARTEIQERSDLRDRPLAIGHDAAARALGAGRASHLFGHLRLFQPQPFSGLRLVLPAAAAGAVARPAADGQHGGRLGPSAGGRIRPVQHGQSLAVPDDCLPQPAAAGPGVFRSGSGCRRRRGSVGSGGCCGSSSASRCGARSGSC